jgi:hypothetical protein
MPDSPPACVRCGDALPDGAPAGLTTCEGYSHWRARVLGDMLTAEEDARLKVFRGLCALDEAVREGREFLRPY